MVLAGKCFPLLLERLDTQNDMFSLPSSQAQATGSPHTSPTHGGGRPMPMPVRSTSAGSTPTHGPQDSLSGVGGDVQEAFAQGEFPGKSVESCGAEVTYRIPAFLFALDFGGSDNVALVIRFAV